MSPAELINDYSKLEDGQTRIEQKEKKRSQRRKKAQKVN